MSGTTPMKIKTRRLLGAVMVALVMAAGGSAARAGSSSALSAKGTVDTRSWGVHNVSVSQRAGTYLVDIYYDLVLTVPTAKITLEVSSDGGVTFALAAASVTGAVGEGVARGAGKHIVWDAGTDWPGEFSNKVQFRVTAWQFSVPFALIPAGSFQRGDNLDGLADAPVQNIYISSFYMAKTELTKAQWDVVRAWGLAHGYPDLPVGQGKASNHPVQYLRWYEAVWWCNAASEMEGLTPCYKVNGAVYRKMVNDNLYATVVADWEATGYRLPTEAEWEKAARGGLSGKRFPWGDTISHSQANYFSSRISSFDVDPIGWFHPDYGFDPRPYTSPVGSFPANGYGLSDMSGNVWEWCWDWYGTYVETADPKGPDTGDYRIYRGASWYGDDGYNCADFARCAVRSRSYVGSDNSDRGGFRLARGHGPAASSQSVTVDTRPPDLATLAPTFTSPASNSATKSPVIVAFILPEEALPGSLNLSFLGATTSTLTLASSLETSGSHAFTFQPANPIGSAEISSGTSIADGVYSVVLSYQDALGNPAASGTALNVRIDTAAPLLSLPANITAESAGPGGAVVAYSAGASDTGSGVASSSFNPPSGSTFAMGTTTVEASATDNAGNTATGSFTITVRDTTAPQITVPEDMTLEASSSAGTVATFTPTATDAVGVTSLTCQPSSGSLFPLGTTTVNVTAKDAADHTATASFKVTVRDTTAPTAFPQTLSAEVNTSLPITLSGSDAACGSLNFSILTQPTHGALTGTAPRVTYTPAADYRGPDSFSFKVNDGALDSGAATVSVTVRASTPLNTESELAATDGSGSPVLGEPAGTTLAKLGVPAIRDGGFKAFTAVLRTGSGYVNAILTGTQERVFVRKAQPAPDQAGNPIPGAAFSTFNDPLINHARNTAFVATLTGTGVSSRNRTGLWTDAFGPLMLVARIGAPAPALPAAKLSAIDSVALSEETEGSAMVVFTGKMSTGSGGVSDANNSALWAVTASGATLLLREGDFMPVNSGSMQLKNFTVLGVVKDSPGHGRSICGQLVVAQAYFSNRIEAVLLLTPGQLPEVVALEQQQLPGAPAGAIASLFGAPTLTGSAAIGGRIRFLTGTNAVVSANAEAILLGSAQADYSQPLVRLQDPAPDVAGSPLPGASFKTLGDPVINSQGYAAFKATLTGTGVRSNTDTGLWWGKPGNLRLVAREGDVAPGTVGRFASFTSLALPDDNSSEGCVGPVFVATLSGVKNNNGLWALNSSGTLQLVAQKGALVKINGSDKPISSITVLGAVPGSPAQARSYNRERMLIYRLNFPGGAQKIVTTLIP